MTLLLPLQTQPTDDSGSWVAGLWDFLNGPVEMSWMHTLFGGLVSALISAGVALVVLRATLKAQNRGIRQQIAVQEDNLRTQLEVQERSVAEQLRVQRNENARTREVAVVGRMLSTLTRLEDERGRREITVQQRNTDTQARLTDLLVGFEELRINGGSSTDLAIDSFKLLTRQLGEATREHLFGEQGRFQNAGMVAYCLGHFLSAHLVRYARMDEAERVELGRYLDGAWSDFEPQRAAAWQDKYVMKLFNGTRR
jgi:hypothetical protein